MPLIGNDARLARGAWAGEVHLRDRLQARSAAYLLGTDHVGRDLLSHLIHGARRESLLRHVLPNIAAPIIIIFSINVGG